MKRGSRVTHRKPLDCFGKGWSSLSYEEPPQVINHAALASKPVLLARTVCQGDQESWSALAINSIVRLGQELQDE